MICQLDLGETHASTAWRAYSRIGAVPSVQGLKLNPLADWQFKARKRFLGIAAFAHGGSATLQRIETWELVP